MSILQGLCAYHSSLCASWKGEVGDDRLFFTFFNGGIWAAPNTIAGNSSIGPAVASVGSTLYAAWKGEKDDQRLFYAAYDGKSWGPQQTIPGNSSVGPSLAVVNGTLYAAWKGERCDQRLFYASLDGAQWSAQQQIPGVAGSIGPSLAAFGNTLYAAWKGEDSDQRLFYASFDGQSWSAQQQIPGVASSIGPSLAAFGDTLYAAWKGEGSDQRLFYASFDGVSWSSQQQIAGVASSLGPALSFLGSVLYAVWKGEGDDQRLWYASLEGSTWTAQATLPGNTGQDPVRMVFIPDVHLERPGQPATWVAQTNWIRQNRSLFPIHAVMCAGDMQISTPGQDDLAQDLPVAWSEGLSIVDGLDVPYLVSAGNHDYDNIMDTTNFDLNIGYQRIYQKPWYAGFWDAPGVASAPGPGAPPSPPSGNSSKATQAIRFAIGSRQILVVALEIWPRQGALDWAGGIIRAFPTYEVIILLHAYMTMSGNLFTVDGDDAHNFAPSTTYNPGFQTPEQVLAWAQGFPNVHAILCGHDIPEGITGQNVSHRVDTAADGHPIVGVYADYQFLVPPSEVTSQVVLLLELGVSQLNVRAFNTTTAVEVSAPYPFVLPWQ